MEMRNNKRFYVICAICGVIVILLLFVWLPLVGWKIIMRGGH